MDFLRLEKNMVDVIKEQQIKLGYRSEMVRLYYPWTSISRLLGVQCSVEELKNYLEDFCKSVEHRYGLIEVTDTNDRACFAIPSQGSDYISLHTQSNEFIYELIHTVKQHGCTLKDTLQVFHKYSDQVHVEKVNHGEFDYLVYFEDGVPDDYRYCLTVEEGHVLYHRFTIEDYENFDF